MNIETLHIGMKVKHPAYGVGTIAGITEHTTEIRFSDGATRTVSPQESSLQPAEPTATVEGLDIPLNRFIRRTVDAVVDSLGLERPESVVKLLGSRWNGGRMVIHPADPSLQTKDVPLETFFHKIVMVRNQLRVLEQKINSHDGLNDGEKVELQQYITRCYGSMTTFNVLFKDKEEQF